jgi:lysine 2,3-aminomutase
MWQDELKDCIRSIDQIDAELSLGPRRRKSIISAAARFPIVITKYYWNLVDLSDPRDPIRRQIIPSPSEQWIVPGEHLDPLKEKFYSPEAGLIHKYRNRALVLLTSCCAVHCRFCFRKHFKQNNEPEQLTPEQIERIIRYLQKRRAIKEIVISGGDPLMLADEELGSFIERLNSIPHLEIVRIHTRMPVVLPSRITPELIQTLKSRLTCWIVTHFNHPNELSPDSIEACARFTDNGIPVLNQTVLLRGINDEVKVLVDLNQSMIRHRIRPYYLHVLDPVPGTSHFRVDIKDAVQIINSVSGHLSGYAVPILVQDRPGQSGKYRLS